MRKFGLVLATVAALSLSSLPFAQPARADGTVLAVIGVLTVGSIVTCAVTKGAPPWCWWMKPAPKK